MEGAAFSLSVSSSNSINLISEFLVFTGPFCNKHRGIDFCHWARSCAIIRHGNPKDFPENRKGPHLWSSDSSNMKIEVEFSPPFQSLLSLERQTLILEEGRSTVKDLFERLLREHGGKIRPLLFSRKEDEILSGLMVMINNRTFTGSDLNRQEIRLAEGDKVSLLYYMSGG